MTPITPKSRPFVGPPARSAMPASAAGTNAPAPRPWTTRATTSISIDPESAAKAVPAAYADMPSRNSGRRP